MEHLLHELPLDGALYSARSFAYVPMYLQRAACEGLRAQLLLQPPRH